MINQYLFRSIRHGLAHFAIGSLKAVASLLFNENDINVTIQHDLSTKDCKYHYEYLEQISFVLILIDLHIVFSVQFDNKKYEMK